MVDIHDYDIQCIEQEILWKYEDTRHDYSDCDCLLCQSYQCLCVAKQLIFSTNFDSKR